MSPRIIVSEFFRLSREWAYSLCVIKNLFQSVPQAQSESCLAYKETENG